MDYDPEEEIVWATLTEYLRDADAPEGFHMELTMEGCFSVSGVTSDAARKKLHVMCYDELYPYAAQLINQLATNSGLSGFMLRKLPLKTASIHTGKRPDPELEGKIIRLTRQ